MTEIKLLDEIRRGNKESYKHLFITFYSPLCEYASQYVNDIFAEEIVEDLMVYIWENRQNIEIRSSLKSYLFVATKNRCINAIKEQNIHQKRHTELHDALLNHFEDPDYYLSSELADKIQKAIYDLPEIYKETFLLSREEDLSYPQIAEKMHISVKTVEYRISCALKLLRIALHQYLYCLLLYLIQKL